MTTKEQVAKKVQRWLQCERCGHGWFSALPRPVVCPRCKSYSWDEKPKGKGDKENG